MKIIGSTFLGIVFCILLAFAIIFGIEIDYYHQGDYLKYLNFLDKLHQYNKIDNSFEYSNHYESALIGVIVLTIICFLIFITPIIIIVITKIKEKKVINKKI